MESKKIAVLLSSYNGEQFIKEQIDSVLNQKECKVSLLVRDDGSTDNTIKILENYVNKGNLNYYCGKNLKPAKSFLDLVKHSPECEFYAFCDQDDVWEEDKLISAINQIGDTSTPTCYHSAYMMVDKDLNEIGIGGNDYVSDTIYKSIISSNSTGCTIVFNKAMRDLLNLHDVNIQIMHDNFIVKLCLACGGKIIHDETPHIKYRQHGNNVIGGKTTLKAKIKRHINAIRYSPCYRSKSIQEIYYKYYDNINEEIKPLLYKVSFYKKGLNRFKIIFDKRFRTGNKRIDRLFIFSVLLGKF